MRSLLQCHCYKSTVALALQLQRQVATLSWEALRPHICMAEDPEKATTGCLPRAFPTRLSPRSSSVDVSFTTSAIPQPSKPCVLAGKCTTCNPMLTPAASCISSGPTCVSRHAQVPPIHAWRYRDMQTHAPISPSCLPQLSRAYPQGPTCVRALRALVLIISTVLLLLCSDSAQIRDATKTIASITRHVDLGAI